MSRAEGQQTKGYVGPDPEDCVAFMRICPKDGASHEYAKE